jgi:hypothetical protein
VVQVEERERYFGRGCQLDAIPISLFYLNHLPTAICRFLAYPDEIFPEKFKSENFPEKFPPHIVAVVE